MESGNSIALNKEELKQKRRSKSLDAKKKKRSKSWDETKKKTKSHHYSLESDESSSEEDSSDSGNVSGRGGEGEKRSRTKQRCRREVRRDDPFQPSRVGRSEYS
jgi:hypothetical protein